MVQKEWRGKWLYRFRVDGLEGMERKMEEWKRKWNVL